MGVELVPPANAMPKPGEAVQFQTRVQGSSGVVLYQWFKNGQPIPGATMATFDLSPVALADGGRYLVEITNNGASLRSLAFDMEPADTAWVVTSSADNGPGTLREVLRQTEDFLGVNGIQFRLGEGPHAIRLESPLPPITGSVSILGPGRDPLTLDGGGAAQGFFVNGGALVLDDFSVRNCLAKGGSGLGGGGGAAGMGGALFINKGAVSLVHMTFQGNRAQGGSSSPGQDGATGGGGGCGGDSLDQGLGGPGFFGLEGGLGALDGNDNGGPAVNDGAGGGGGRGGSLDQTDTDTWQIFVAGGAGGWGGGGGFSVGPEGGGGNGSFGGGGGGSGGVVHLGDGKVVAFPGASGGAMGVFGGDGGLGDGAGQPGRGGGGGGMGGAIFLRDGTLAMSECAFLDNAAEPGEGFEPGFGKGGAVFIYALPGGQPMAPDLLLAQAYEGNLAVDAGAESPDYDNANFYIAQEDLLVAAAKNSAFELLYRRYRMMKQLGLIWPGR